MEHIASLIHKTTPSSNGTGPSGSSTNDGLGCRSCGLEAGLDAAIGHHRCCYCADGGRVRDPQRFGMSMLCPQCSGAGAMGEPEVAPEVRMMVPGRFREVTFADWKPDNGTPRLRAQGYVAEWPPKVPLLVLTGNKGTGKTTLACAILRATAGRHGVRGQFWPVIDLLDRYRRTFDQDRATETVDEVDQQMRRMPLLVLDDYGAHKGTEFAEERLFALIDYRYREGKPLVVTSNVSLMEMQERVRSRFTDTAACQIVNFAGRDMRPTAGQAA